MKHLAFLFLSLFFTGGTTAQYIVNDNLMVHYELSYSNDYRFSTALTDKYILETNTNNTNDCMNLCAYNTKCLGIYETYDNYTCNLLSGLGIFQATNETSNSYTKLSHHNYPLGNHSVQGIIFDTNLFFDNYQNHNITVYIDINHNGELDENEPSLITHNNKMFYFDNITEGTYLIRQISPENCVQFYPGLNGSFILGDPNINGDGYVDAVIRYKHNGHPTMVNPHGGYVNNPLQNYDNNSLVEMTNFSFIIGDDDTNFMSFYPDYSIIMAFIDDSIVDNDGEDLIIKMYGNSSTYANISVSHDDINYKYLGVFIST